MGLSQVLFSVFWLLASSSAGLVGESLEVQELVRNELQELRLDIVSAFLERRSRQRRETEDFEWRPELRPVSNGSNTFEFLGDGTERRSVFFNGKLMHFREAGLFEIDPHSGTEFLKSGWPMSKDQFVAASFSAVLPTGKTLFVLVCDKRPGFSYIYVLSSTTGRMKSKQKIRTFPAVTDARFFQRKSSVYLVMTTANSANSLASCPIYKWQSQYFDEIHSVHARGANSVDVIIDENKSALIAISQYQDSFGNSEIGTQILKLDQDDQLEKLQLLPSHYPIHVHFTKLHHEVLLVVAQRTEGANVFVFGGHDFSFNQKLESINGENTIVTSVRSPDGETCLIAASGSTISSYCRDESGLAPNGLMFYSEATPLYQIEEEESNVTGIVFEDAFGAISTRDGAEEAGIRCAVTWKSEEGGEATSTLKVFELGFVKVASGRVVRPRNELGSCFESLQEKLGLAKPFVDQLKALNETVIRRDDHVDFNGTLVLNRIQLDKAVVVRSLEIDWDTREIRENASVASPMELEETLRSLQEDLKSIEEALPSLVDIEQPMTIATPIHFHNVTVESIETSDTRVSSTINGLDVQDLKTKTLRKSQCEERGRLEVAGSWEVETLEAEVVDVDFINGMPISDVLLKRSEEPQTVEAEITFQGTTKVASIDAEPEAVLNGVEFSDIATKSKTGPVVISGLKRVEKLDIASEVQVDLVNGISLEHLATKALKTHCGSDSQVTGGSLVFEGDLNVDSLQVGRVNGVDWNSFRGDVMLDGVDQVIKGSPNFGRLEAKNVEAGLVQGIAVDELMDKDSEQRISSRIRCGTLRVRGNVQSETINGIKLQNFVMKGENATITSGIHFEDDVEIRNLDFSHIEAAAINEFRAPFNGVSNRVVMYELAEAAGMGNFTVQEIQSDNIFVSQINQWPLDDLESSLKLDSSKEVFDPERSDYSESHVVITNGLIVDTLNGHLLEEYVKTTDETIGVELAFETVYCNENVVIESGGLLNGVDLAEWNQNVVRRGSPATISGHKTVETLTVLLSGLEADSINGIDTTDFVMLNSTNKPVGGLKFERGLTAGRLHAEGPLAAPDEVSGFNLTEVQRTTVKDVGEVTILDSVKFENPVSVSQMAVGNNLNDLTLQPWLDHAIHLNSDSDQSQVIYHDLNILGDLICEEEVSISKLNGIAPTKYFEKLANLNADEHILDTKTFRGQVIYEDDLQCDRLSKIHLRSLANEYVSKTKDQELTGTVRTERLIVDSEVFDQVCFPGVPRGRSLGDQDTSGSRTIVHEEPHSLPLRLKKLDCGDVSWESDNFEHDSLHRLLKSAVVKSAASQTVVGMTEFAGDIEVVDFQSANWVSEVDFSEIAKDGVRTGFEDGKPIVFSGNYNLDEITVGPQVDTIQVTQFDTRTINSYVLEEIDEKLVKRDEVMPIRGRKTLGKSLKSNGVYAEQINGCNVDEVLTTSGEVEASSVNLELVEGAVGNVEFEKLNLFDWKAFKRDLVLNGTDQTIGGNWTFIDGLHVEDFTAEQVNDVALNSTIKGISNITQDIHGKKEFAGLTVLGNIQASTINNHDIEKIAEQVVCKDADHKFEAPVALGEKATFKSLDAGTLNGRNVSEVVEAFSSHEKAVTAEMELAPEKVKVATRALEILKSEVASAARGPLYLESNFYFHNRRAAEVRTTAVDSGYQLAFVEYRKVDQNQCGLPNGCFSPRSSLGVFRPGGDGVRLQSLKCRRQFSLKLGGGLKADLFSEATTYNSTCVSRMDKPASLKIEDSGSEVEVDFVDPGTVMDVKSFFFEGRNYIVLVRTGHDEAVGIYHELAVYKLDLLRPRALEMVQVIPLRTASKFDLDFVSDNWFLAVGPSWESFGSSGAHIDLTEISDHVQESLSEIYVWSSGDSQFINLRDVPTGKVTDFEFVTVNRGLQCEKSFLFVGHTGNLVDVLVYDADFGNFLQYQTLSVEAPVVTSVEKFEVVSEAYVVIGTSDGLLVYDYRCVEGFKLYMPPVPIEGVNGLSTMVFPDGLKLAIASTWSMIADVVSL